MILLKEWNLGRSGGGRGREGRFRLEKCVGRGFCVGFKKFISIIYKKVNIWIFVM